MLCSHVDTLGEEHTDLLKQQARAFEKMADRLDKEDTNKLKLKDKTKQGRASQESQVSCARGI
jgi:hypothetical protein